MNSHSVELGYDTMEDRPIQAVMKVLKNIHPDINLDNNGVVINPNLPTQDNRERRRSLVGPSIELVNQVEEELRGTATKLSELYE